MGSAATAVGAWVSYLSVVSLGVAVAGFLLALYNALIRDWLRRPALWIDAELHLDGKHSDLYTFRDPAEPQGVEHALRLRVHNKKKKDAAVAVEVVYLGGDFVRSDGFRWRREYTSQLLRWSGFKIDPTKDPLSLSVSDEEGGRSTIHPGFYRHFDLLQASSRARTSPDQRRIPRLCVIPYPQKPAWYLEPGLHTMYFAVRAQNADASAYRLTVSWDGGWSDDPQLWWTTHVKVGSFAAVPLDEALEGAKDAPPE